MISKILLLLLLTAEESAAHSRDISANKISAETVEVLEFPDPHSKNMLQKFVREYNDRTPADEMIWGIYGIIVVAQKINGKTAVVEIAETTCSKRMPTHAKCRFFNGAHKRQCRVSIAEVSQKVEAVCKPMGEIQQAKLGTKYQRRRWLWDPDVSPKPVQTENYEQSPMGSNALQFVSRHAIGKEVARKLNLDQKISHRMLMHFGEIEVTAKQYSYEAVVHLAESNCHKSTSLYVDPYEQCRFAYPGLSFTCIVRLSMHFLVNGPVLCRHSERIPPNRNSIIRI
uniref:Cystatin domain-containing protein n=1 Tax=Trichuris muris TaxID=70415 RepID=A0A5S6R5X2_TRIMR